MDIVQYNIAIPDVITAVVEINNFGMGHSNKGQRPFHLP